jgi:hypothetical protein
MQTKLWRFVGVLSIFAAAVLFQPSPASSALVLSGCASDQCSYGTGCYDHGACLGCQRCSVSGSTRQWTDDRSCPSCGFTTGPGGTN